MLRCFQSLDVNANAGGECHGAADSERTESVHRTAYRRIITLTLTGWPGDEPEGSVGHDDDP